MDSQTLGDKVQGFASAILTIRLKNLPADTEEKDLENALRACNINANRVKVIAESQDTKRAFVSFLSVAQGAYLFAVNLCLYSWRCCPCI
jgi:hypothetical protein